ncbi:MAG: adenine nucleotide transporter 17 [Bacillariaceae sp.]|jgi:adenine nucleotide transporter 17
MGRISLTSSSSPWSSLLSSCLAGIGNVLCTNPLWVTNMAIVSGTTKTQNLLYELIRFWNTHGASHLWKGTNASMMLVSNPIIQFVCYEQLKRKIITSKMNRQTGKKSLATLGAAEAFVIAAAAKAIATVLTYPLQLTQTLLRLGSNNNISNSNDDDDEDNCVDEEQHHKHQQQRRQQYKGTVDCLIQLYKSNDAGITAWFTGMRAKLLQTVLTAAFTFLTYEQILGVIHRAWMMRKRQRQIEQ